MIWENGKITKNFIKNLMIKRKMTRDDEDLLKMFIGGLIGAALASPKPEDKKDLEEYKRLKQEIVLRQRKVGDLPYIVKLLKNPLYVKPFTEAYKTYLYGFYRSSIILNIAIIESLLKEKYGDKDFYDLIEEAKKQSFIDQTDYHFLHAIRTQRNLSAHDILKEVSEEDAVLVIRIVNKMMYKFV